MAPHLVPLTYRTRHTHLSNLSTQCPVSGKLGRIPNVHSAQRSKSLMRKIGLSNIGFDLGKDSYQRYRRGADPVLILIAISGDRSQIHSIQTTAAPRVVHPHQAFGLKNSTRKTGISRPGKPVNGSSKAENKGAVTISLEARANHI